MDPSQAAQALAGVGSGLFVAAAAVLVLGYFYIFWDKRKDESSNKDDGQAGLKLVLYTLLIVSLGIAAGGVNSVLSWLLAGAKGGSGPIKLGLAHLAAGGGGVVVVLLVLLPRTNTKDYPQAERFAAGAVAVVASIATVISLDSMLTALLGGAGWRGGGAQAAGGLLVAGGLAFLSVSRFGSMSGWTAPAKPAPMMQQGGFPPQAGGYQPQAQMPQGQPGGYQQPQGGGYPPQGGQMGGGYPPQGGGQMPPGGGYPPQGGGGYQPR